MATETSIPEDLIMNILLRIPARSLLILRSVCKSWCNLISHPQFASNHVNHQQDMILFLRFDRFYRRKFVSYLQFKQSHPFTDLFEIQVRARRRRDYPQTINFHDFFKEMFVCGSINGIVCLSSYRTRTCSIVLWNPTINKWKPIPFPAPQFQNIFSSIGFAFDSLTHDYKIIMLVSDGGDSRIHLYSANHDAWEEVTHGGSLIPFRAKNPNCSVIVKGVPYWTSNNLDCEEVIAAFDPHSGLSKFIPYPKHVQNDKTSVYPLNLMDSLAILMYSPGDNPNNIVDVYVLDHTPGTWIKIITTGLAHLRTRDKIHIRQCFEEAGEIILVFCQDDRTTVFYNPKTNCVLDTVASLGIDDECHPMWDESYRHMESLVCIRGMELLRDENEEEISIRAGSNFYEGRPLGGR